MVCWWWSETVSIKGAPPRLVEPYGWGISVSNSGEIHLSAINRTMPTAHPGSVAMRSGLQPRSRSDARNVSLVSAPDTPPSIEDDYARAGFSGTLGWGHSPAVIVIDVCRAYVEPTSPLYAGVEDAVAASARLVDVARSAGVPVVFTRVEFEPGGADGGLFYEKVPALACFDRGNPLADWCDPLGPRPIPGEVVVTKQYASAFFGTSLAATLTARGIDTLVICGLSTSGCVRATGVDSVQHGFRPLIVSDACGDRAPGPHDASLFDLGAKYADIVTLADVTSHFASHFTAHSTAQITAQ